jgi:hypothetical protein
MSDLGRKFMAAALGTDGAQALRKAAEREPQLDQILIPRAIVGWLSFTAAHEYEGPIPGIENSYVQFQKSDSGFSGSITLNEGVYSFEQASIYHLAASIAMALGVETGTLDADVRDTVLVKLGKSIDTLAKAQVLMQELKSPKVLSPQTITQHGHYHVERDSSSERPYLVVHTLSKSTVQRGIGNLKDAGEIANWHQKKYKGEFKPGLGKKVLDPNAGYTFHHEHNGSMTTVRAFHPDHIGDPVGVATFKHHGNALVAGTVGVDEAHQRRGVASAMYAHAQKVTGKTVHPSKLQTDEGEALWAGNAKNPQFGKVELPGSSHKPTAQQGPQGAMPPQKQPTMGQATQGAAPKPKLPKAPKQPGLAVGKSEAERPCEICEGHQFENNKFKGCICFRDLAKSIKTTAYGDGYVLDFSSNIDAETVKALMKTFRSRNG